MTPFLDLRHIVIDASLVQQLPPGLASFYEALPVAREGNSVTVAMSHPENVTALGVLTQLFRAEIVPIRTDGTTLRTMLQQLYLREPLQPHGLLAWLPADLPSDWAMMLATMGLGNGKVSTTAQVGELPITWLDAELSEVDTLLTVARGGNYELTLCTLPHVPAQAVLLRDIHTPLWLVPAAPVALRRILLVLRGFASDEVTLNWVIWLAASLGNPSVTLLPLLSHTPSSVSTYLQQQGSTQDHITDCAQRLLAMGIQPTLTLQSGEPRLQVVQAMRQWEYDLVVIAAEGHGHFVGQVLASLLEKSTVPPSGMLILKPSHLYAQRLPNSAG